MAWVGMTFYALHVPAILSTLITGKQLLALQAAYDLDTDGEGAGVVGADEYVDDGRISAVSNGHSTSGDAGGLSEPLLARVSGAGVSRVPSGVVGVPASSRHSSMLGRGEGDGLPPHPSAGGSLPARTSLAHHMSHRASMGRRTSDGVPHLLCSSIPGHASPIAGSMG